MGQTFEELLAEKEKLKKEFENLRLDMKDTRDYEAVNRYRIEFERLQLQNQCLDTELVLAQQLQK